MVVQRCNMRYNSWGHYMIEIDLPTYNGERNPKIVQSWLSTFEQFFAVKLTPDWQRIPFASFHLIEYAHTWWRYVKVSAARRERDPVSNWAQFTELILHFFMPLEYIERAKSCLVALRRSHYKSLCKIFNNHIRGNDDKNCKSENLSVDLDDDGQLIPLEYLDETDAYFSLLNKVAKDFQSNIWDNIELPSYGGERDPDMFDTWIDRMETYLDAFGIYGAQRIRIAAMQLKGRGFTIWRFRESTMDCSGKEAMSSWREFKSYLMEKCLPNYTQQARSELTSLKHTRSLKKYNCRFWELSMRIPMLSEEDKVKKYISGLKKKVHADIMYSKPLSLDNAMKLAFLALCRLSRKSFTPKIVNSREMHLKKGENKLHLTPTFLSKLDDYARNLFPTLMHSTILTPDFSYLTNENQMQQYMAQMNTVTRDIECRPCFLKQELRMGSISKDFEQDELL